MESSAKDTTQLAKPAMDIATGDTGEAPNDTAGDVDTEKLRDHPLFAPG